MSGMFSGLSMKAMYNPLGTSNPMKAITDPMGMFSTAKPADPAVPPPAPTLGNSSDSLDVAAQQQQMMLQRGRSATLLTGGGGLNSSAQSASKVLLGQ